jgi:hypothetical protein
METDVHLRTQRSGLSLPGWAHKQDELTCDDTHHTRVWEVPSYTHTLNLWILRVSVVSIFSFPLVFTWGTR